MIQGDSESHGCLVYKCYYFVSESHNNRSCQELAVDWSFSVEEKSQAALFTVNSIENIDAVMW